MSAETKDGNATTVVIDGQHFTYECWLMTPPTASGSYAMQIPGTSIKELQLRDSLYDLFPSGLMVVENTQGGLYSIAQKDTKKQSNDVVVNSDQTLYIESAGRDMIYLKIKPVAAETKEDTGPVSESWALGFLFNILDTAEAGINQSTGEKFTTFELVDVLESYLDSQNFDWNTGFALTNHLSAGALNLAHSDIQCPTGVAIKEFLKFSLGDMFAIEFAEGWPIDGGNVRYSAAPFETGLDTLKYLYNSYGHADGPSVLKSQPADTTGSFKRLFSLRTLSDICKGVQSKSPDGKVQPGVFWRDCFIVNSNNGPATNSDEAPTFEKSTTRTANKVRSNFDDFDQLIDRGDYTGFENYLLDGIKISGSRKFLTTWMLHCYDECSGQFDIKSYPLSSAHDDLQSLYVDNFPAKQAKTLIPVTPFKEQNKITNTLHVDCDDFNIQGKNAMLFKSLFLGPVLSFRCKGESYRRAGTFVSIASQTPPEDTHVNNILYGEWFVTTLTHRFVQGAYIQDFGCSKFYSNRRIMPPMTHIAKKESQQSNTNA